MPTHIQIARKVKKVVRITQAAAIKIWNSLSSAQQKRIKDAIEKKGKLFAITLICSIISSATGLPRPLCHLFAEKLYKFLKKRN